MNINPFGSNSPIYSRQATQAKSSLSPAKFSLPRPGSDKITISPEDKLNNVTTGNLSLSQITDGFMDGAGKDGVITVEEILAFGEKYREKADQVLDETLKELGIPSNTKISISTDAEGKVRVSADLPESNRNELEQALNDRPDFQQHYTKSSSSYSLYKAAEKHMEFTKLYENNPKAAVALFGVGSPPPDFIMEYLNGDTQMVEMKSYLA